MERHMILCLLALLCLFPAADHAQGPLILHYGGGSLPGWGTDTAFCKGKVHLALNGDSLASAPSPWAWLSTSATLGGIPCPVSALSDTLVVVALPDSFPDDTCVVLEVAVLALSGGTR